MAAAKPPGRLRRAINSLVSRPDPTQFDSPSVNVSYLALYLALVLLPLLFTVDEQRESISLAGWCLPPSCPSHLLFGRDCPGCGLGRSFVETAHGHFCAALACHRLGLPLYGLFCMQAVFRVYCLRRAKRPLPRGLVGLHHWAAILMIALLVANWLAGFRFGGNGS